MRQTERSIVSALCDERDLSLGTPQVRGNRWSVWPLRYDA